MHAKLSAATAILALGMCVGCAKTGREEAMNEQPMENVVVVMETSMGTVKLELWASKAPETVKNFLRYVDISFYDGTIFHRVIRGFMIQGGGFKPGMENKTAYDPITNEAAADRPNVRGRIAMARTPHPHSASAQFFINVADNASLNYRNATKEGYGYCVFGKVIEGMDVVDKIRNVKTGKVGQYGDVPVQDVVIKSVRRAK